MTKVRPEDPAKLTDFRLLSFDVYSTLIDEEGGMFKALKPLLSKLPNPTPYLNNQHSTIASFQKHEHALQISQPSLPYNQILAQAYTSYAHSLSLPPPSASETQTFASSIGIWPPFLDTVSALKTLKKYYKLVILSNIDNASIAATIAGPLQGVPFDAVYTAQDIGTYKPDRKNFEYLLKGVKAEFGVEKEQDLHTAQSLRADHVPAKEMGMTSVWISRDGLGEDGQYEGKVQFTWEYKTLGEMAADVEREFEALGR